MNDLRYALRSLARSPGFTAVAVITLALGAGTNSLLFSVIHAVLLRPLPYPDPDQIVSVALMSRDKVSDRMLGAQVPHWTYFEWRDESRSFAELAAYRETRALGRTFTADEQEGRGPDAPWSWRARP